MNLGWLDAVALAPALERAVGADRDTRSATATAAEVGAGLADYDRNRRRASRMAVRQAGFNMAMGRPYDGVPLHARNALVRILAVPPTNEVLARAFTMRWL